MVAVWYGAIAGLGCGAIVAAWTANALDERALRASVSAMWSYDPAAVPPLVEARIGALVARDDDGTRTAALRDVAGRCGEGRLGRSAMPVVRPRARMDP